MCIKFTGNKNILDFQIGLFQIGLPFSPPLPFSLQLLLSPVQKIVHLIAPKDALLGNLICADVLASFWDWLLELLGAWAWFTQILKMRCGTDLLEYTSQSAVAFCLVNIPNYEWGTGNHVLVMCSDGVTASIQFTSQGFRLMQPSWAVDQSSYIQNFSLVAELNLQCSAVRFCPMNISGTVLKNYSSLVSTLWSVA